MKYIENKADQEVIGTLKVRLADLTEMNASEQRNVMREWFFDNYEDPAQSLPYESREGGYIWIDGGPYDAHEELYQKFEGLISEQVIEGLGKEFYAECHEWAAQIKLSDDDLYIGFDRTAEPEDYLNEYRLAMESNRELLDVDVLESVQNTFYGMVFVNLITIMETYLSDTFIGLVPRYDKFLRKFVESTPEFKQRRFSLAKIYDSLDRISRTTEEYLNGVVWHRLRVVLPMYRDTLEVSFPENLDYIFRAVEVRHALVHRNGKIEGKHVDITKDRVQKLAEEIDNFICSIAEQIENLEGDDPEDSPF